MKKIVFLTVIGYWVLFSVKAWADGEKLEQVGAVWVNPVEYYSLRELNRTDFQRDYDQGDIDFNRVLVDAGLKVYALKLKPIAIAGHIEGEEEVGQNIDYKSTKSCEYQEIMDIKGVALNEPSFCIYADGGISRSYSGEYIINGQTHYITHGDILDDDTWVNKAKVQINISSLCIAPDGKGIGISYAMTANEKEKTISYGSSSVNDKYGDKGWQCSKSAGIHSTLGHFIYYKGSQHLLLMLSADLMDVYNRYESVINNNAHIPPTPHQMEMLKRPWMRVYFEVEEMLVQEGDVPVLDEKTRTELRTTMDGLLTWLSGEGDPLGLGEHTSAKVSAVINTLSTIAALLTANGLVSIIGGGSGGSLVGNIAGGVSGSGTPPPAPDTKLDSLNAKRKEDEEEETPPPPPEPVDPNKFDPSKYPYGKQFLRQDSDGDVIMKSPVTGKDVHYYSNGDGTWISDSGITYSQDDIAERLRYEAENAGVLKQDAETAARNAAEQHQQWMQQNERDLARGYSDEMKEYQDYKAAEEAKLQKQLELERLGRKYGVPPTEKAVKNAIKFEQAMNQIDADTYNDIANQYDQGIKTLETIDKTCEIGVNVLSGVVPGGSAVKDAYTFAKATLVAASEAVNEGKSLREGVSHVLVGAGNGALGVIQNQAGDLAGNGKYAWVKELGINILTEDLKEGMNGIAQGKSIDEIGRSMINATGSKTAEFGIGKLISGVMGQLKDTTAASLDPTDCDPDKFYFSENTAAKLDKWLFKPTDMSKNISTRDINLFSNGKIDARVITKVNIGGTMEEGSKLVEGVTGELYSNLVGSDWGGDIATWANNKVVDGAANIMYGGSKTIEYFKNVANFSDAAATFINKN